VGFILKGFTLKGLLPQKQIPINLKEGRKMKKLLAIGTTMLAIVFLVAPGIARAGILDLVTVLSGVDAAQAVDPTLDAPPNDGAHDFAVGGGHQLGFVGGPCNDSDPLCGNFGFSAHSGPAGENPQGHLSGQSKVGGTLRGDVVCLQVLGNQAFALLVETRTGDFIPQGEQFFLHVVDNGNPVDGMPPDLMRVSFVGFFTAPLPGFPCGLPVLAPVPLGSGNIVVHDEP